MVNTILNSQNFNATLQGVYDAVPKAISHHQPSSAIKTSRHQPTKQ
jgi:hypothetical protein